MIWYLKLFALLFIIWGLIVCLSFNPQEGAKEREMSVGKAWFFVSIFFTLVSFVIIWLLKGLLQ